MHLLNEVSFHLKASGPAFVKFKPLVIDLNNSKLTLTSCESPNLEPMNTTPLSRYVRHSAIEVCKKKNMQRDHISYEKHKLFYSKLLFLHHMYYMSVILGQIAVHTNIVHVF